MIEEKTRALLVEDDPEDAFLVRELLERNGRELRCELVEASTLASAVELVRGELHVVLLDLELPDSSGIATFLQLHAARLELPIVVLTGTEDRELALEAVRLGAQDYLVKGEFDAKLLARSVAYSIERGRLVANLRHILDKAGEGMVVVDGEGVIRYMNRSAERLFGREAEELLGAAFPLPIRPDDPIEVDIPIEGAEIRTVLLSVQTLDWRKEASWLVSMQDLTDLKFLRSSVDAMEAAGSLTPSQKELLNKIRAMAARASATLLPSR